MALGIAAASAANAQPAKVPDSVRTLVADLMQVPAATPDFSAGPGQRAVQLILRVGARGWESTGSTAIPIPASRLAGEEDKASKRRRPPYGWLVVLPAGRGAPVYWAPIEDPFEMLHEFTHPGGRLSGARRRKPNGVVTARLPLVPGAQVVFVDARGDPPDNWNEFSFTFPGTSIEGPFNPLTGGRP